MTTVKVTVLDLDAVPEDCLRDGLTGGDVATTAHVRNERRRRRLLAAPCVSGSPPPVSRVVYRRG
jgi:hypothetical protein